MSSSRGWSEADSSQNSRGYRWGQCFHFFMSSMYLDTSVYILVRPRQIHQLTLLNIQVLYTDSFYPLFHKADRVYIQHRKYKLVYSVLHIRWGMYYNSYKMRVTCYCSKLLIFYWYKIMISFILIVEFAEERDDENVYIYTRVQWFWQNFWKLLCFM